MSRGEASAVIDSLIEKTKNSKRGSVAAFWRASDYKSDALAGVAVKILAQRHDVRTHFAVLFAPLKALSEAKSTNEKTSVRVTFPARPNHWACPLSISVCILFNSSWGNRQKK